MTVAHVTHRLQGLLRPRASPAAATGKGNNSRERSMVGNRYEQVAAVTSASLSDALGRLCGHRSHVLGLVSPTPDRVLFGRAATIRFVPFRQDVYDVRLHSFARLFYEAIAGDPVGKVVVMDSSGHGETSVGGGTKLSRLQNHGLAGLITDGRLRDFRELAGYEPVSYCRGETLRAGTGDLMPVSANEPVNLGGAAVLPGDYIFADAAGTVIIPSRLLDDAFDMAHNIETQDLEFIEAIRNEDPEEIRRSGSSET
jgi:4-hydroxy-4-methyl-2-oxoglutarate aldolase